jgi:AcrR family transcriptional regulator
VKAPDWKARQDGAEYAVMRKQLVDAAEQIVRDRGAAGLRLESVADAVGLHRSSVYRYVDSKEELLTAVVVQVTVRVSREVIDAVGEGGGPERALVDGMAMAMARIATEPGLRSMMAPTSSEAMTRLATRALLDGIRPLVEPLFAAAAESGLLRSGVTSEDALRWLLVVAAGLFRVPELVPDRDELTRLLELMFVPVLFDHPDDRAHAPRARA